MFRCIPAAVLLFYFTSAEATQPAVVEIDSVDSTTPGVSALHSLTLGSSYAVHLASYHCFGGAISGAACRADGGEGFFIQQNGTSCTEDKGRVLKDAAGNCYYRQNLNGDLRQWGATIGSSYDCSPTTGAGAAGCSDALALLNAMQTSVSQAAFGIHHLTAAGVQIKLLNSFTLGPNMDFDNAAQVGGGGLVDVPGTVLLGNDTTGAVTIDQSDFSSLHNMIIEPGWFPIEYPTGPSGISHLYAVRDTMVSKGMTAVTCANANACNDYDLTVAGFDTAFDMSGQSPSLNHIRADGNVCFWYHDTGTNARWSDLTCSGLATRGSETNEYFSITNVADNGSGVCRVTVTGGSVSDLAPDMMVWVSNLNLGTSNAVNANGRWKISLVPGHSDQVDLQGSVCINDSSNLDGPSPTGTWVLGENRITGLSSTANIRQDQEVILPGGTTGLHVIAVWATKNTVSLDGAITASNSTGTVTFRSPSYSFVGSCSAGGSSPCFVLSAAERVAAGSSAGGSAAGGVATAFMLGTGASGIQVSNAFVYGYARPVRVNDTQHVRFANFGTDATRSLKDDSTGFMLVDGSTKSIEFVNGGSGKDGDGLTINTGGQFDKGCVDLTGFRAGSYEVDDGCLNIIGTQGQSDYLLVGADARRVQILGNLTGLSAYYETAAAQSVTDTNGLRMQAGPSWWGGQIDMGGPSPSVTAAPVSGASLDSGSNDSAGRISVTASGVNSLTLAFASVWPGKRPVCYATDEASNIAVRVSAIGNTSVTFSTSSSSSHFNVSDNISYLCVGFSK